MMDAKAAEGFCGHPVTASVGHNNPPEPTLYEAARDRVEDLYREASLWMDGAKVEDQDLADGIANLLSDLRKAWKAADDARKEENEPFDAGKAEVQARYNPLLKKAKQAEDACKAANEPWLLKKKAEVEAAAKAAREEADRKRREAEEAIRATDAANLAARAAAEALLKEAKRAETVANKAERTTAKAGGATGKSMGLRTTWKPVLTDSFSAAKHYWETDREQIEGLLLVLAARDVAEGKRTIPGFEVQETFSAV